MSKDMNIFNLNLYQILGVKATASTSEIKTAYRKKALECHPDKNLSDPKAKETFHQLHKAMKVLTDISARTNYDRFWENRTKLRFRKTEKTNAEQRKSKFIAVGSDVQSKKFKTDSYVNTPFVANEQRMENIYKIFNTNYMHQAKLNSSISFGYYKPENCLKLFRNFNANVRQAMPNSNIKLNFDYKPENCLKLFKN